MSRFSILTVFLGVLLIPMAIAQEAAGTLTSAYHVYVKPGMGPASESALRSHAEWREANGDPWTWRVYQVTTGTDLGDLVIRSTGHSWADFDAYDEFLRKGAVHFSATMGPVMEDFSNTISQSRPGMSRWPQGTQANLVSVVEFGIRIGAEQEFEAAAMAIHEAFQKADEGTYAWSMTINGNRGPTMTVGIPFANWSAMGGGRERMMRVMAEAHGAEKAGQIMKSFGDSVRYSRNQVVRYRPDLSVNAN